MTHAQAMRIALDTNILVYLEGVNDAARRSAAVAIVQGLHRTSLCVPMQVFGELFNVLTRKARWSRSAARNAVLAAQDNLMPVDASFATLAAAIDLAVDHEFFIWDALIVATAADAGCRLLLSEDLHEGFVWRGLTIVNPFAKKRHPMLQAALS